MQVMYILIGEGESSKRVLSSFPGDHTGSDDLFVEDSGRAL